MRIEQLSESYRRLFIEYMRKHAEEHDPSFLPEDDFTANERNPTYILIEDDSIVGAASLMFEGFERIGKARFRILHTTEPNEERYRVLLDKILPHAQGVSSCFTFIPEHRTLTRQIWETIGFNVERYAFVLRRSLEHLAPPNWPKGYTLRPLRDGEEATYAYVLNSAFRNELGRYDKTADDIKAILEKADFPDSMHLLSHEEKPVGILAVSYEEEPTERAFWINTIGLIPDYQGLRLGRQLLRAGCIQAPQHDVQCIMLSVQAQNGKAADLYLSEGFEKIETAVCYQIDPKHDIIE